MDEPPRGTKTPAFLEGVLAGLPDALFVKDREHRYVLVNAPFLALARKTEREVIGLRDEDVLPAELAVRYHATDREVLERGRSVRVEEETYVDPERQLYVIETTKVPLRDQTGAITHVLGLVHDVTRRKQAEDDLRHAKAELERRVEERTEALRGAQQELLRKERLAVLGQLAGGLAHQIRNPLAAITNAASVLKRRLGESADSDVQQALTAIREEVWEANRIITDLLDYARIRPPSRAAVRLESLIASALPLARADERVVIETSVDPSLHALVDERQMRDALGNVLRNGVEAMPDGGTLRVESYRDGESAAIAVQDTGPGLTRASLAYLFEPLVTSKPLGLGLGLATAKALIENQGGTIRCTTSSGSGARFEIRVPAADE